MEKDNLIGKGMRWSLPYYQKIKNILRNADEDPIQLTFNLLSEISSDSVIIFGVDNMIQLKKAIKCIKQTKLFTNKSSKDQWWKNLPHFPEKFLILVNGKNTKITALIQARMGSTRLPGKVMKIIQKNQCCGT